MEDKKNLSPEDFREALEKLFEFIPYFEERVNGTFKFQYYDDEKKQIADYEGYEEANRNAKFPDPMYDETFSRFEGIFWEKIGQKITPSYRASSTEAGEMSPQELFTALLFDLKYDILHERMCTGHTAYCMKNGNYLQELKLLRFLLNQMDNLNRTLIPPADLQTMPQDERNHAVFNNHKILFDTLLSHGAIDQSLYKESLARAAEKMGIELDEDKIEVK